MDGVLINSEPLWKLAEQHAFAKVGLQLTDELCAQTTGFDCKDTVAYWFAQKPWDGREQAEIIRDIENFMLEAVETKGVAMPGVYAALQYFKEKGFKLGLASSAPLQLIKTVVKTLKLDSYFETMHSSDDEKAGKPDPAVYLATAKKMNVKPEECIAIEDSYRGVLAAHRAGMKVIAIPDKHLRGHEGFKYANLILNSLEEVNDVTLEMIRS
jgi:sugar-phosphatase